MRKNECAGTLLEELTDFARTFIFPRSDSSAEGIARASAESHWLRTLVRGKTGGLETYRRWASDNVPKMIKSSRYVINQAQFDILARRTGMDLLRSWRSSFPGHHEKLSLGAAFRAVDLLFMAINESESCRSGQVQGFLHAPLGKATLLPLRACIDELVDEDYSVEMPANMTYDFIVTEDQYILLQKAILAISGMARVAPLTYAYFCSALTPL